MIRTAVQQTYTRTRQPNLEAKQKAVRYALQNPISIQAEKNRRHFFTFMKDFWPVVSSEPFIPNWHIEYICEQLQTIATRVANRIPNPHDTIINVPPGTTKTMTVSIMFPAWCWTNWPWLRFITSSYSAALSLESAEHSRDLIRSEQFKQQYPHLDIKHDKDQKSNYKITFQDIDKTTGELITRNGGNRFSTSVGATITGFHGHINIVDDPLHPLEGIKDIATANKWMRETLPTRKVDKKVSTMIMIMQRLHQEDCTGYELKRRKHRIFHICLPGEIWGKESEERVSPPELKEKYVDGLLDKRRMDKVVLTNLKEELGQYGYAGQVEQNPTPAGGGMFKPDRIQIVHGLTSPLVGQWVRYWDKAGTQDDGCYTVGLKMGKMQNGKYIIANIVRGQWDTDKREEIIQQTAKEDGLHTIIYMEQEPGSGGKDSVKISIKGLDGYTVYADLPTGSKVVRADPFSVQVNAGNVEMIEAPWNDDLKDEMKFFPNSAYKDQVDAGAGAYARIRNMISAGVW